MHQRTGATDDPLWVLLFPVYYAFGLMYGGFAAVYYLPILRVGIESDPAFAELFGLLIAVACTLGLAGSLVTIASTDDRLEAVGTAMFLLLMVVYFGSLCWSVAVLQDPGTRPGSVFVPLMFSVAPAIRLAVIVRKHRRARA